MAKAKGKTDKKDLTPNEKANLQSDLKRFGYLLPTNEEEVEEFDKIFGKTQVMFPDHLKRPGFLNESKIKSDKSFKSSLVAKATSEVPTFKAKKTTSKSLGKGDYFKKLVLAAEVAYQLHEEPAFGHVKFVKVYLLCDQVCHMNLSSSYGKYAAGPLDPKQMYTFDAQFKKKQWFTITKTRFGFRYSPDAKIQEYQVYYKRYFKSQLDDISRIIELFRKQRTDFCEIVATIFFIWKEFMAKHKLVNNASLIKAFYAWGEEKKRFSEGEIVGAIDWMNENGIIPT